MGQEKLFPNRIKLRSKFFQKFMGFRKNGLFKKKKTTPKVNGFFCLCVCVCVCVFFFFKRIRGIGPPLVATLLPWRAVVNLAMSLSPFLGEELSIINLCGAAIVTVVTTLYLWKQYIDLPKKEEEEEEDEVYLLKNKIESDVE